MYFNVLLSYANMATTNPQRQQRLAQLSLTCHERLVSLGQESIADEIFGGSIRDVSNQNIRHILRVPLVLDTRPKAIIIALSKVNLDLTVSGAGLCESLKPGQELEGRAPNPRY